MKNYFLLITLNGFMYASKPIKILKGFKIKLFSTHKIQNMHKNSFIWIPDKTDCVCRFIAISSKRKSFEKPLTVTKATILRTSNHQILTNNNNNKKKKEKVQYHVIQHFITESQWNWMYLHSSHLHIYEIEWEYKKCRWYQNSTNQLIK